ncbi:hypothetical protein F4821DRAFT_242878 [Hypoxylon rubiginosum]|uniref:Uncharacterized protein n=1 Tax=Hypoxylon rubiginosum TaxID=110542 RepID=A0ACC0CVV3_9PEZI|nr:hypothetical protein F4821DRAFT_242878 [Hypoxylon rubiginosum]
MQLAALLISLMALAGRASAVSWYFLRYFPATGQKFTSFSGEMTIPTLQKAGVYYLWPGLQPSDNSGVYQNVLDGRSGTWWIGSGWCCSNPSLPWGSGFNTYAGEKVTFNNRIEGSSWTSTLTRQSTGETVTNSFALTSKSFNQALFAIELYDVSWDFGPLAFSNVVITSEGSSDSSWCNTTPENYNSATTFSISGLSKSVSGNKVTCKIGSVTLQKPA